MSKSRPVNYVRERNSQAVCGGAKPESFSRALRLVMLSGLLLTAVFISLFSGSVRIVPFDFFSQDMQPIIQLRILRIIAGIIAGSGLAVCGVVLQAVLRNPLAEPYLLGTSSGAGLGAVAALSLGVSGMNLPPAAFTGAVVSIFLVFSLARQHNRIPEHSLILSGVVISVALSAIMVFLITVSPNEALHGMLWWLWGSLRIYDFRLLILVSVMVITGIIVIYAFSHDLNAMSIGTEEAQHLGIPVERVRKILLFISALLTAGIVCICGIIGFVGLLIPHMMRLIVGPNHKILIPASCITASSFMILCDALARSLFSPLEIPIGVISALVGAPVFMILLKRKAQYR